MDVLGLCVFMDCIEHIAPSSLLKEVMLALFVMSVSVSHEHIIDWEANHFNNIINGVLKY